MKFIKKLVVQREFAVFVAVALVITIATIANPGFATGNDGFRNLLLTPTLLMVLATGMAVVIVTKNIDLSVSAVLGLTAYTTGRLFREFPELPPIVVILIAVLLGAFLGSINGLLVSVAKVPSLVITLGTLYIYRGITIAWAGSDRINASDLPEDFKSLGISSILGIPVLTIIAVLVVAVAAVYLSKLPTGRELYAIGSDPDAAHLYGLPVRKRVFTAFVISGGLAGLAGVMFAARYATVSSNAGEGLELQAVAAAVIGGVAIFGGSGTAIGAALGAILLATINRALPSIGIQDFWQQAVVGSLIIGAIVLDRVLASRSHKQRIALREKPNNTELPLTAAIRAGAANNDEAKK